MTGEEKQYNRAGRELVDWVDKNKDTVDGEMLCVLFLDSALDLTFFALGSEQAKKLIAQLMLAKIREHNDNNLDRN